MLIKDHHININMNIIMNFVVKCSSIPCGNTSLYKTVIGDTWDIRGHSFPGVLTLHVWNWNSKHSVFMCVYLTRHTQRTAEAELGKVTLVSAVSLHELHSHSRERNYFTGTLYS